jgi:site-specific DNA-methyltransferase (adenine-specific)
MEVNKIIQRNVLDTPWPFDDNSIDCCVTSPPYWGLRDYGVAGQLGLEKTPEEFVAKMVQVFEEVKRILKPEGTCWINIGDSYASSDTNRTWDQVNGKTSKITGGENQFASAVTINKIVGDLKPKDLVGVPWMLAFALRSAGWYLRQDIIWHKPNPMPESATDRCTKAHEYIFLLSKSRTYYFDAYAIATPYKDKTLTTHGIESKGKGDGSGLIQSENWANSIKERKPKVWKTPDGWDTGEGAHGSVHRKGREKGLTAREKEALKDNVNGRSLVGHSGNYDAKGNIIGSGKANKRSVWTVATAPFKEDHFATFPEELILPCILAGCPKGGVVLDPFMGAGTTALVAKSNDRNFIGLELNPEYIQMAEDRLKQKFGMFHTPITCTP